MAEVMAVKRAEEPTKLVKFGSLFDQIEDTFNTLTRRAYEIFDANGRVFGRDLENWLQAERELFHPVALNLVESPEAFELKVEVPGFSEKELESGVEPHQLTITGKRESSKEEKKGKTIRSESTSDQILRTVDLPKEIDPGKVIATLKNGMLELTLPKVAQAQTVRVRPKVAA